MNKSIEQVEIKETDDFPPSDFPQITKELIEIKESVKPLRFVNNELIILSYLKNHQMRDALTRSHPAIIRVLTSKNSCPNLEALFAITKENSRFRLSLENYVTDQLNK